MLSFLFWFALFTGAFVLTAQAGVLPPPLLSLYALINHAIQKKARFTSKKKRKFNLNEIIPGLFVGMQPRAESDLADIRQKFGITALVSVNEEHELFVPGSANCFHTFSAEQFENAEKKPVGSIHDTKFLRLSIPVPDYQGPNAESLSSAVRFIETQLQNGGKVFVHCNGGKGRSVAVIVAYLLAKDTEAKLKIEEVVKEVKQRRKQVSKSLTRYPFSSQSRNLKAFQDMNKESAVLGDFTAQESVPIEGQENIDFSNAEGVLFAPPPNVFQSAKINDPLTKTNIAV